MCSLVVWKCAALWRCLWTDTQTHAELSRLSAALYTTTLGTDTQTNTDGRIIKRLLGCSTLYYQNNNNRRPKLSVRQLYHYPNLFFDIFEKIISCPLTTLVYVELTVHKTLILPKPQHPNIHTGSGFLMGMVWTRWTVVGVACCEYCCWAIPTCLPCASRPGRNNAFRSACCPKIPFIVVSNPLLSSTELTRLSV